MYRDPNGNELVHVVLKSPTGRLFGGNRRSGSWKTVRIRANSPTGLATYGMT